MALQESPEDATSIEGTTQAGSASLQDGPELDPDMQESHPGMRKGETAVDYFGRVIADSRRAVIDCEMMGRTVMGG